MNYTIEHRCEQLRDGWAACYTLGFWNGRWNVTTFLDNDPDRFFPDRAAAEKRNRELATNWLALEDPDGAIYERQRPSCVK
jgi:hypothetical protein